MKEELIKELEKKINNVHNFYQGDIPNFQKIVYNQEVIMKCLKYLLENDNKGSKTAGVSENSW